jgi:hypothetical protein
VQGEKRRFLKRQTEENLTAKTLRALHRLGEQRELSYADAGHETQLLKSCIQTRYKTLFGAVSASVQELTSALGIATDELRSEQARAVSAHEQSRSRRRSRAHGASGQLSLVQDQSSATSLMESHSLHASAAHRQASLGSVSTLSLREVDG